MDPITISALIAAGTSLFGGLMQGGAAQKQQQKQLEEERKKLLLQSKLDISQKQADAKKEAMQNLIDQYRSATTLKYPTIGR